MAGLFSNNMTTAVAGLGGVQNGSQTLNCSDPSAVLFRLTVNGIMAGPTILLGIIGNILAVIVLSRDFSRSSMSVLLSMLGVYDLIFLLLSGYKIVLIDGISRYHSSVLENLNTFEVARFLIPSTWYLGNVARTGRNWIAVVVAIDRYIVVRNPFGANRRSNAKRAKLYSIGVTAITILYNLPRLWEFVPIVNARGESEMTASETMGKWYNLIYSSILFSMFVIIGPIILLTIFNGLLTVSLIKASNIRATLTQSTDSCSKNRETRMLCVLIGVFIATELPGCVAQIILVRSYPKYCAFWDYGYTTVNFLAVVNSSVNFAIYCMCGRRFRESTVQFFCRHNNRKASRNLESGTYAGKVSRKSTLAVALSEYSPREMRTCNSKTQVEEMIELV